MNYGDVVTASVNQHFYFRTILRVSDIDPNNSHVYIWRCFNNVRVRSEGNVIENMSGLDNALHYIGKDQNVCTLNKVENTKDFKIKLRL